MERIYKIKNFWQITNKQIWISCHKINTQTRERSKLLPKIWILKILLKNQPNFSIKINNITLIIRIPISKNMNKSFLRYSNYKWILIQLWNSIITSYISVKKSNAKTSRNLEKQLASFFVKTFQKPSIFIKCLHNE